MENPTNRPTTAKNISLENIFLLLSVVFYIGGFLFLTYTGSRAISASGPNDTLGLGMAFAAMGIPLMLCVVTMPIMIMLLATQDKKHCFLFSSLVGIGNLIGIFSICFGWFNGACIAHYIFSINSFWSFSPLILIAIFILARIFMFSKKS